MKNVPKVSGKTNILRENLRDGVFDCDLRTEDGGLWGKTVRELAGRRVDELATRLTRQREILNFSK